MALKDTTKRLYAQTLDQMLEEMPFSKITVTELCHRSGTAKQTFYYHFIDKQELAAWSFLDHLGTVINGSIEYSYDDILAYWRAVIAKAETYRKLFKDAGQNGFRNYYIKHTIWTMTNIVLEHSGLAEVPSSMMMDIRYFAYGMAGLFESTLNGETGMTAEELATCQYNHTPTFIRDAMKNHFYTREELTDQSAMFS